MRNTTRFAAGPAARHRLSRPLRRRFLRAADRRAARGRDELRQVPRRLVGQHGVRLRAAGSRRRTDLARRRRRDGPLPRRDDRARRLRRQPRRRRSVAAHRGGRARHRGQGHVPADLPARELRRHGDRRRGDRGGVHRAEPRAADHRHALLDRVHRRHQQSRARSRARARRAHGARHRLPAGAVGTHQARRRRDALHRVRHGDRAPAADAAAVRSRHRHDRGVQHRRRQRRHPALARGGAPAYRARCSSSSAGRWAAR